MALKVADGRGICHRQKTRFADGKVEPLEKLLLPMAGPSATVQFAGGPAIGD